MLDRRKFCLLGLSAIAGLFFQQGCSKIWKNQEHNEPKPEQLKQGRGSSEKNPSKNGSEVYVAVTEDRRKGVRKIFEMVDGLNFDGKRTLVKPNFNTADPAPASTHNDTLITIIECLKGKKAGELILGERSGPPLTREVLRKKGIYELAEKHDFEIINFDELKDDDFIHFSREDFHWKDGFLIPKAVVEAEALVATCCLKTHAFGGIFTMALKLAVGMVPRRGYSYMSELHGSRNMRKMIAEINTAFQPDITIIDGIEAFVDGGPSDGKRKRADVFLASKDRVALDAVGVAVLKKLGSNEQIMNTPIFMQEQIARAVELGLGVKSPEEIKLIYDDIKSSDFAREIEEILLKG